MNSLKLQNTLDIVKRNSPMKPLLRKIFFWDAPAQGAFFGLTLLLTLLIIAPIKTEGTL